MNKTAKTIVICGGALGGIYILSKLNQKYAEQHNGEGFMEKIAKGMDAHPVASAVAGTVLSVGIVSVAKDYHDINMPAAYYEMKRSVKEAQIKQKAIDDEKEREDKRLEREHRERMETYRIDKERQMRQEQLDYDRQMPPEYWIFKAEEQKAINEAESLRYVSDNALEAEKTKWEAKKDISENKANSSKEDE